MRQATFLFIFYCLFIGILGKVVSDSNIIKDGNEINGINDNYSTLKEYTYKINNYAEEVIIESNSLLILELNNFPPESIQWFYNDYGKNNSLEYLGKDIRNTCSTPTDNNCEDVSIFKFHIKEVIKEGLLPSLEFCMIGNEPGHSIQSVFVTMKLKKNEPMKELLYQLEHENAEVVVEPNTLLTIELRNNSTLSGYEWMFYNSMDIIPSKVIEFQNVQSKSNCNVISKEPKKTGCNEIKLFTFKINDVNDEKSLPLLMFINDNLIKSYIPKDIIYVNLVLSKKEDSQNPEIPFKELTYQLEDKESEIIVEKNSLVKIELKGQFSLGYRWAIANGNDIKKSDSIEIQDTQYHDDCQDKNKNDINNCMETVTFTFLIKDIPNENLLPQLKFIYNNLMMSYISDRTMTVSLKLKKEEEPPQIEDPQNVEEPENQLKEYTYEIKNYEEDIIVYSHSFINIELNNFPPESIEWYYNENGKVDFFEYLGKERRNTCSVSTNNNKCEDVTIFKFHIKEVTKEGLLPLLEFCMIDKEEGHSSQSVHVRMQLKGEDESLNHYLYKLGNENKEVIVEPNSILIIEHGNELSNPGNRWSLFNIHEINESELIEFQKVKYRSSCNTISKEPKQKKCGETSVFTFKIKDVTNEKLLPTLRFLNENMAMSNYSNDIMEVTLKLKGEKSEEPEIPHKELSHKINWDDKEVEIIIEEDSLLKIEFDMNLSMGYTWFILNTKEIKNFEWIENYGSNYSECLDQICNNELATFTFHIKKGIPEDSILPKLKFVYENLTSSYDGFNRSVEVTLKLKKEKEEEEKCSLKGYPCCTKENPKVYYNDKDGDWSVENDNWCFISKKKDDDKEMTPTNCFSIKLGYPCCTSNTSKDIYYTDHDGDWGYQGGNWCGITH